MHQLFSPPLLIASLLFSPWAVATQLPIGQMSITTASLSEPLQGFYPTLIHIGPNTDLVGGYIGSGGTTTTGYAGYAPDNVVVFELNGITASVYTAAANLGDVFTPQGSIPGGPVPYGTLDTEASSIALDVRSFFLNSNDTDFWMTSPWIYPSDTPPTGSWGPHTGAYTVGWSFYMPAGPGFGSTWYITLGGTALPIPEASTLSLWLAGLGLLLPLARTTRPRHAAEQVTGPRVRGTAPISGALIH